MNITGLDISLAKARAVLNQERVFANRRFSTPCACFGIECFSVKDGYRCLERVDDEGDVVYWDIAVEPHGFSGVGIKISTDTPRDTAIRLLRKAADMLATASSESWKQACDGMARLNGADTRLDDDVPF